MPRSAFCQRKPWTSAELNYLSGLAGDMPAQMLVDAFNAWAIPRGLPRRTLPGIEGALHRHFPGLSLRACGTWLRVKDAAQMLGCSRLAPYRWQRSGLRCRRIGTADKPGLVLYVHRDEIRRFAREHPEIFGGSDRAALVMLLENEQLVDRILQQHPLRRGRPQPVIDTSNGRRYRSITAAARAKNISRYLLRDALAAHGRHGPLRLIRMTA